MLTLYQLALSTITALQASFTSSRLAIWISPLTSRLIIGAMEYW